MAPYQPYQGGVDPSLYASTGSVGDIYGAPSYGNWRQGSQLLGNTPSGYFQSAAPQFAPGPAYGPPPVSYAPAAPAYPPQQDVPPPGVIGYGQAQQFADGASGKPMSPEDCARLGLPAGSVVLEGGTSRPQQVQQQQPQYQPQQQQPQYPQQQSVPNASIGASFTKRADGAFMCDAVTAGSSAAASGLQMGMMLEKIDKIKVSSMSSDQVVARLMGKEGSIIMLRYRDSRNQIIRKQIVRDCYAEDGPVPQQPQIRSVQAPAPPVVQHQYVQAPAPPVVQHQYVQAPAPPVVQRQYVQAQPQVQYVQQPEPQVQYIQQPPVQYMQQPPPMQYAQPPPVEYVQYEQPMPMRGGYAPMDYGHEYMSAPAYGAPQYGPGHGEGFPIGPPGGGYGGSYGGGYDGGGPGYPVSPPRGRYGGGGYGGPAGYRNESDFGGDF